MYNRPIRRLQFFADLLVKNERLYRFTENDDLDADIEELQLVNREGQSNSDESTDIVMSHHRTETDEPMG